MMRFGSKHPVQLEHEPLPYFPLLSMSPAPHPPPPPPQEEAVENKLLGQDLEAVTEEVVYEPWTEKVLQRQQERPQLEAPRPVAEAKQSGVQLGKQ